MSERSIKFRDVVRPPLWLMAFIYFLAFSLGVAIWASLNTISAAIAMAVMTIGVIAIYFQAALVIEVDEREAVAHVAGVAAVREAGEVFLTRSERLLVLVGEEVRHRQIIEGVFDERAVREVLEELGENRRGFLEIAVLEHREALIEGVAVEALGLGEPGFETAVKAADFGPVAALGHRVPHPAPARADAHPLRRG